MPNIDLAQIAFSRLIYQIKQAYQSQGQAMIGANPMQGVYPQPQYPPPPWSPERELERIKREIRAARMKAQWLRDNMKLDPKILETPPLKVQPPKYDPDWERLSAQEKFDRLFGKTQNAQAAKPVAPATPAAPSNPPAQSDVIRRFDQMFGPPQQQQK